MLERVEQRLDHGLPSFVRWQVRPVRRRLVPRVCALLLRGADGLGNLPVALRAEKRAISARGLSKPPTPANDLFQEETDDPLVADRRNFITVELWTRDGRHIERLLFAGNSLDKARALFAANGKRRPRAWLTIRQRSRVLAERPRSKL
jgi:hypothetical protein